MSANVSIDTDPTMSAIRSILHDDAPSNATPKLTSTVSETSAASLQAAGVKKRQARQAALAIKEEKIQAKAKVEDLRGKTGIIGSLSDKLKLGNLKSGKSKLPLKLKRKHAAWAGFGLLVLLRPSWFILTSILTVLLVVGAFAIFGADKTWGGVMRVVTIILGRSPERMDRFAKRMDRFANRWDGFLDRFPEGMVDGLYLPDFQSIQEAAEQHEAVVDARLSRLQAEG